MKEHLKKRDEIRHISESILKTYGKLNPKLQHLAITPLPNKDSVIQILDDILEVIYPGYYGGKHLGRVEYRISHRRSSRLDLLQIDPGDLPQRPACMRPV